MLVIFDRGFNAYQFVELTELNVTLKLINSPFLEKKIRGIKEIIQFITRLPPKAGIINTIIYN